MSAPSGPSANAYTGGAVKPVVDAFVKKGQPLAKVAIVGVGLIGGSFAAALRRNNLADEIYGIEADAATGQEALALGLVDQLVDEVPAAADLVVIAIPSDQVHTWALHLREHSGCVLDVASVKAPILAHIQAHGPLPANFVPCHPISGSEKSGPGAAKAELFEDAMVALTPTAATSADALTLAEACWRYMGAQTERLTPETHDELLALTSHLPHLLAFAYMQQIDVSHLSFTGGGFRDFTRIAAAHPALWLRIFSLNRKPLLSAAKAFSADLRTLIGHLESGESDAALSMIEAAAEKRGQYPDSTSNQTPKSDADLK
tara:strand:+ start:477 stop:1427 length:951 start_codon:yes stop_codon:yes gene_type:complete